LRVVAARSAELARRAVAALVSVAIAGSLIIGTATRASADGLRISVYGDSVLLGASEEITGALAGNDVSVDAHENVSLLGTLPTLDAARPTIGDVVVLDLGYNDGAELTAWRERLDRAAAILDGVPKVIWLTQREFADGRAEMNNELRAVAQLHPNIEVADWNGLVASNADLVYGDGIHLTPAGQAAMADLVKSRIDAFVAARVAATSTTVAPTTTSRALVPSTTEAVAGAEDRTARALRTTGTTDDDDDTLWFGAIGAALVVVVAAALIVVWFRARARARNAG
jgi:lysophospholipase L1-like esterase